MAKTQDTYTAWKDAAKPVTIFLVSQNYLRGIITDDGSEQNADAIKLQRTAFDAANSEAGEVATSEIEVIPKSSIAIIPDFK